MLILVDSREQKPYWQDSQCAKIALHVGDYTTALLMGKFHIERKSAVDLYGTLTKGNRRFQREVMRAHVASIKMVVVIECTRKDFEAYKFPGGERLKYPTRSILKTVDTFTVKYNLQFIWCKNRSCAKAETHTLLVYHEEELTKSNKTKRKINA